MAGERRVQIILFFLHLSLSYLDLFSISSATDIVPFRFLPSLIKRKQFSYTVRPLFYPFGTFILFFHFSLLFSITFICPTYFHFSSNVLEKK